jgi:S-DNA-T family DNA segregation ATPase FtsK/SpoIIIE
MQIVDCSVEFGERAADVRVAVSRDARITHIRGALAAAVAAPTDLPLWCDTDLLPDELRLPDPRLRAGARLRFGAPPERPVRTAVLSVQVVGGPAAGRVLPFERGRLTIGRADGNDLTLPDPDVSRRHADIDVSGSAIAIHDLGSTNGTWLDGRRIPAVGCALHVGDIVRIGDSLLRITGPSVPPASVNRGPDGSVALRRSPRPLDTAGPALITRPAPTTTPRPRGVQWIAALLPAAAGAVIAWVYRQPIFLLFALLSPLLLVSTALGDRLQWRRAGRRAARALRERRAEVDRQIAAELAVESARRRRAAPDPATIRCAVAVPDAQVWARQRADPDLLRIRLGSADLPSTLAVRDGDTVAPAGRLADVPACIDLADGPVGLAGPGDVIAAAARGWVGQLGALCAPADIEFALLLDPGRVPEWHWTRWLPQLRSRVATTAPAVAALVADLAALIDRRVASRSGAAGRWTGSWTVLVVDRRSGRDELAGLAESLSRGASVGVTAVWLETECAALPSCCSTTARVGGVNGTRATVRRRSADLTEVVLDQASPSWADEIARNLAPIVDADASDDTAVPASCTLLDALELADPSPPEIKDRWQRSTGTARSTLGRTASGPLHIDLARDGPHALVVGTTGSGKSELLRSLVAGLAANQPPTEVNLLLIDYKGGAAFAGCAALPHAAGLVTDLDHQGTERALRSLHAELRQRERLFADVGADDLAGYRASAAAQQLARLVIVVDEFATLAAELPDFLAGLIAVAQRGRSLGVHLVLATQHPGAAVSGDIRANIGLRIVLRVIDPGESQELLRSPAAAAIDPGRPGRGYVLAGSLAEFQAAHATGVSSRDATSVDVLDDWRRARRADSTRPSDLDRLVGAVCAATASARLPSARCPWRAPLPDVLRRADLPPASRPHAVALGRVDLPDEQRQDVLELSLDEDGSLLIAGPARSGRSNALALVALGAAASCSPHRLQLHVVDPAGGLATLLRPLTHATTVLGPTELDLAPRLLARLADRATERLAGDARGPALLLLVDGWEALCAALPDLTAVGCTGLLTGLLRSGRAAGLGIVVTGEPALLSTRLAAGFPLQLQLGHRDRSDARRGPTPSAGFPPGRAIRCSDGAVVQLAVPDPPVELAAIAARHRVGAGGLEAIRIRPLPDRLHVADVPTRTALTLGLAGDEPAPAYLDPFAGARRVLIAGAPRSGRSTLLRLLSTQARDRGIALLVAAPDGSPVAELARGWGGQVLGPQAAAPAAPTPGTLVLIDDSEAFAGTVLGDRLAAWARDPELPAAIVAAARSDDLAITYRGVAAEVRRHRCGIVLRPGPLDAELLGVRSADRRPGPGPPGRGLAVGDPSWGPQFPAGEAVPIQLATPDPISRTSRPCADNDDRSAARRSP